MKNIVLRCGISTRITGGRRGSLHPHAIPHLPLSASVPIRSVGSKEAGGATAGVNNDRRCDKGSAARTQRGRAQRKLIARDRGPDGPIYEHTCSSIVLETCLENNRGKISTGTLRFRAEIKTRCLTILLLVSFRDSAFATVTKSLAQTYRRS